MLALKAYYKTKNISYLPMCMYTNEQHSLCKPEEFKVVMCERTKEVRRLISIYITIHDRNEHVMIMLPYLMDVIFHFSIKLSS